MLAYDPSTNPLNNNEWSFPLLEIIHIAGFALSIGTIVLVDLSLLGTGIRRATPMQLNKDLAPWTLVGLAIMLITGPLIFSSDPNMYLRNSSFIFKMWALGIAIIFNYTVHRWAIRSSPSPGVTKSIAIVSIALWVSVVAGGLFIAFV